MSIKLMSIAWDMDIPSTEKMVLLCLCDYADDNGRSCYPAIATLAKRTSKNARTVQRALRWLEKSKICDSHERAGTSTDYTLNLAAFVTPDKMSPLTKTTKGGGVVSGGGRRGVTQSTNEPPIEPPIYNIRAKSCAKPDGVCSELWADWLSHRGGKFSQTALAGFEREAAKAGWTLTQAFTEAIERKWQGFKADWVKDKTNGNSGRISNNTAGNGFRAALRQVQTGYIDEPWGNNSSRM